MAVIKRPASPAASADESLTKTYQRGYKDIYRKAAEWGIRTNPLDIESVIKKFGIRIHYEEMDADLSGYIENRNNGWVIGINMYQSPRRQRFTLAHEFAHFLFDKAALSSGRHTDAIMLRSEESDSLEQRANDFAADLLMPADRFRNQVDAGIRDVGELSEQFDVSMAAIRYRAFKLGYIKRY